MPEKNRSIQVIIEALIPSGIAVESKEELMTIGGVSIILILGIINFILILFQVSSGRHLIKVPLKIHRAGGFSLLICAAIHAGLAIIAG